MFRSSATSTLARKVRIFRSNTIRLTRILLNLAVNARDAMHSGGRLTLETSCVTLSPETEISLCGEPLSPGDYVLISVGDNGSGMSDEVKAPFRAFSRPSKDPEADLAWPRAMASCDRAAETSHRERSGTRDHREIYLPKLAPPPRRLTRNRDRLPSGSETILVLEDDIGVRHIPVRVLRGLGYAVIEAANGDDAQQLFAQSGERKIDLLLTDMVMPKMSGRHFADWLRKTSPKTKVVFVSGYLEESLHPRDRLEKGTFFLAEPFDPEQLARKIREVLDSKAITR